jgi:hypothetical protein
MNTKVHSSGSMPSLPVPMIQLSMTSFAPISRNSSASLPAAKAQAKPPLTSPSLQTSQRAAGAHVGATGHACGCPRSTAGAETDTRANNRDGLAPTRVGPGPGSRDNRRRSRAWPFASVAVGYADRLQHRSIFVGELAVAARMPGRRPHTAASPCMHLRPATPSEVLDLAITASAACEG